MCCPALPAGSARSSRRRAVRERGRLNGEDRLHRLPARPAGGRSRDLARRHLPSERQPAPVLTGRAGSETALATRARVGPAESARADRVEWWPAGWRCAEEASHDDGCPALLPLRLSRCAGTRAPALHSRQRRRDRRLSSATLDPSVETSLAGTRSKASSLSVARRVVPRDCPAEWQAGGFRFVTVERPCRCSFNGSKICPLDRLDHRDLDAHIGQLVSRSRFCW